MIFFAHNNVFFLSYRVNLVKKQKHTLLLVRYMQSSGRRVIHKLLNPSHTILNKKGLAYSAHTPIVTTNSNEGLNNNEAYVFRRKNKAGTVVNHTELVETYCDKPGCSGKFCLGLCGEKTYSKSIGHFTHSNDDKHKPQKIADTDFDNNPGPNDGLFIKRYEHSHQTTGKSYDPVEDERRTLILQKMMKKIYDERDK